MTKYNSQAKCRRFESDHPLRKTRLNARVSAFPALGQLRQIGKLAKSWHVVVENHRRASLVTNSSVPQFGRSSLTILKNDPPTANEGPIHAHLPKKTKLFAE